MMQARYWVGRVCGWRQLMLLCCLTVSPVWAGEGVLHRLDASLGKLFATPLTDTIKELEAGERVLTLSVQSVRASEGDEPGAALIFTLSLNRPADQRLQVDYTTRAGSATAGIDFLHSSGTVVFEPGQQSATVQVELLGDTQIEPDESFTLLLSNIRGGELKEATASGIILNDDAPTVSIEGVEQAEGDEEGAVMLFRVYLSEATYGPSSIEYFTTDVTARSGEDYQEAIGTLDFKPGEVEFLIPVTLIGDQAIEGDEQFAVVLRNPHNLTIAADHDNATGTLLNDDQPSFTVSSPSRPEGNSGSNHLTFHISLSDQTLTELQIAYTTRSGRATSGEDFRPVSGVLVFAPGELEKSIEVAIIPDRRIERDESLFLVLSGDFPGGELTASATITNDDLPLLSIADVEVVEGDHELTPVGVDVVLSEPFFEPIEVSYRSENFTAQAGSDYRAISGRLSFAPGETRKTLRVDILGDDIPEGSEQLKLVLFDHSKWVRVGRSEATLTIFDDQDRVIRGAAEVSGEIMVRRDALGAPLAAGVLKFADTPWHCVEDRLTGLTWEVKQTSLGLHQAGNLYSYHSTSGSQAQGVAAAGNCSAPEQCDTQALVQAVNEQGWCGYRDWRLPSRSELETLLLPSTSYPLPSIDTQFFPNTQSSWYWSGSADKRAPGSIWSLDFSSGNQSISRALDSPQHVRLVRGARR